MTPGTRIREERELQGLTQGQLATAARMSQGALSEIESGESKRPRGDSLMSICRVLRLNPNYVTDGKLPKFFDWDFPMQKWSSLDDDAKTSLLNFLDHLSAKKEMKEVKKGQIIDKPITLGKKSKGGDK